jgi:uncharacterized protein (DUF2336 family)
VGATRDRLDEIEHLASSAAEGEQRDAILRCVTDLFLITAERQRPPDRQVFGTVMTRLASEAPVPARAELAERLADEPKAPIDLVRNLAADIIHIARPLLERSPVLTDVDLARLSATCGLAHSDAISRRGQLSRAVTEILARHGDDLVLLQIVSNPSALITRDTYEHIADRAEVNAELRAALMERADLPVEITARLREKKPHPRSKGQAQAGTERSGPMNGVAASEAETAGSGLEAKSGSAAARAVRSHEEAKLAELARASRFDETVAELGRLTGLEPQLVRNCLFTAEVPALVVLCKAHGFASPTFSALLQLRQAAGGISTKGIASAMRRFETMDPNMAGRIMRFLQVRLANPG